MRDDTEQAAIVQTLLGLYAKGQFPMGDPATGDVFVYDPDPRAVIPLDDRFHTPGSLAQRVRSARFEIRTDTAFERVVHACAAPRPDAPSGESTWITDQIAGWYLALHRAGHAHSVEAWLTAPDAPDTLVGGLYGVHLAGLFAGESMFSRPDMGGTDASKVCLVHLVHHLRDRGFTLLDTQFRTAHLARFGVLDIPRARYRALLSHALTIPTSWTPFDPGAHRRSLRATAT